MEKNNTEEEKDIKNTIKLLKEKFYQKKVLDIIAKELYDNSFLIHITFKSKTDLNSFLEDISFSIMLIKGKIPYIKCITNFTFPTLFDNRNLYYNIMNENKDLNDDSSNILEISEKIIQNIPIFLKQCYEDISIRVLVYYGIYNINEEYNMNDFIENNSLLFYRFILINNNDKTSKKKYFIISDIYILIFEPKENEESKGYLKNKFDIKHDLIKFEQKELNKKYNKNSIYFQFKHQEIEIILLNDITNDSFIKMLETKKKFLSERFDTFIRYPNDINNIKYFNINGKLEKIKKINSENINNLISIIKYKEKIYECRKRKISQNKESINLVIKELITCYEKIIEILSAKGKDFTIYLTKLKTIMVEEY